MIRNQLQEFCEFEFEFGRKKRRAARLWEVKPGYMTELIKEQQSFAGTPVFPISNNGAQYTGTVDMSKFNRVSFVCISGTVGGGGNCQFQLQQTNNSNGQSNTNVAASNTGTGTALTIVGSSQMSTIECRADQLTARYAQVWMLVNTNASVVGCIPEAFEPRQHPQSSDVSAVTPARVYA